MDYAKKTSILVCGSCHGPRYHEQLLKSVRPRSVGDGRSRTLVMTKKIPKVAPGIHQRRTRFIKEYILDHNATQAAIRAGYSEKSANVTGCRLLADANVRSAIEKSQSKIDAKLDVTVERVTLELARLDRKSVV